MSYLLFTQDNNQKQKIDTQDAQNVAKYNLITKVFLDIFSQSQQLNIKVEILTDNNESLNQQIQKLEQQIKTLLQEYQTTLELNNKLQRQNTIFQQRNQDLENNQKLFIQRLGGIVYKENLEDKTWNLVLEKAQLLVNERNESVIKIQAFNRDIEVIKQKNELLIKEKDTFNQSLKVLRSIIATKDSEIISLTQNLEFKVKELQSKPDHNIELAQTQNELKNLQDVIVQKDDLIQSLEIEKGKNLQKISLLEASVISEKSNYKLLTQENISLNSRVKQLEEEIQFLKNKLDKVIDIDSDIETLQSQMDQKDAEINNLKVEKNQKDAEINNLKVEKNQNIQEIKQLETKLTEKELGLKTTVQDSHNRTQELEQQIASLTRKLRNVEWELSVLKVGDSTGLIEELRKQISQKNNVIKKLEFENSQNRESIKLLAESFDELTENFNEKEYQLELVIREKIDLDSRVKELEGEVSKLQQDILCLNDKLIDRESEISELKQDLSSIYKYIEELEQYIEDLEKYTKELGKYADDLEQYAEDLENYYLEKLKTYSDTPDINELEELQRQPDEKDDDQDACIEKLKSENYRYSTIIESLQDDIKKQESKLKVIKSCPRYWL
jgi:chromosome segregation ATPase